MLALSVYCGSLRGAAITTCAIVSSSPAATLECVFWTEALPGTLLRWLLTLILQPDRLAQSRAYVKGIRDGLAGRTGRLWPPP